MGLKAESLGEELEIAQTDFDLPRFYFREVAAVHANAFGHLDLRPAVLVAEITDAPPESHANVTGHSAMMVCSL